MKYIKIILIAFAITLIPSLVFASPVDVNRLNNDHIEPLNAGDYFQAVHVDASSVTATSTLNGNLLVGDPSSNSLIFDSINGVFRVITGVGGTSFRGGAVGIGTSSPAFPSKLGVYGGATIGTCADTQTTNDGLVVCDAITTITTTSTSTLAGNLVVGNPAGNSLSFDTINGKLFIVTGALGAQFRGGGVGVGTTTDVTTKFIVNGGSALGTCINQSGINDGALICGPVGISTSTPGYPLTVQGDVNYTGNLYKNGILFSSGNSAFTFGNGFIFNATSSDAVGIGSTTPSATLAVQGSSTQPTRDIFSVASSTGARSFQILANGRIGFFGATPVVQQSGTGDLGTILANLGLRAGGSYSLTSNSVVLSGASSWSIEGKTGTDSTQKTLATFEAGVKQTAVLNLFTQSADGVVQNTVSETSILGTGVGTKSLPANFFAVSKTTVIHVGGVYSTPIGTPSVTVKVKYGTTVLASKTTTSLLSGASGLEFNVDVIITNRSVGATGTVVVNGHVEYATGVAGQSATDSLDNGGLPVTIDTTAGNALDVTLTWDSATATRIATSTVSTIDVKN